MADTLPEHSTDILGELLKISLNPNQAKLSKCDECGKACRSISVCEFCLANELYTRRKTMAFIRLDLCIQAAVCLIAKSGTSGAQARGARKVAFDPAHCAPYLNSESLNTDSFYSEFFGDSDNAKD